VATVRRLEPLQLSSVALLAALVPSHEGFSIADAASRLIFENNAVTAKSTGRVSGECLIKTAASGLVQIFTHFYPA